MTPQQKAQLFKNVCGLQDSPNENEAVAAFLKERDLRPKMGWPSRAAMLRLLESTVTPAQLEAVERERDQWIRAHDDRVNEIAARDRRIAILSTSNVTLRSALWTLVNWPTVAAVAMSMTLGSGGLWWWSNAQAAPDPPPPVAQAGDGPQAAADASLRDWLSRTRWAAGDATPMIARVNDSDLWVVVRGRVDPNSHSDAWGRPIERHCLQLFAREAVRDAGAFVTPSPYLAFGHWMKWPLRAAECRMPGTRNYQ